MRSLGNKNYYDLTCIEYRMNFAWLATYVGNFYY